MLRGWIKDRDAIYASSKGTKKRRIDVPTKELEMEQRLHELFLAKRKIGRKIGAKWIERNAQLIYANIYPNRIVREEGKLVVYKEFHFSYGWFTAFLKRKGISLQVIPYLFLYIYIYN
jgi:hypothetical protein